MLDRSSGAVRILTKIKGDEEAVSKMRGVTLIAVSYTHLDVYKRQAILKP